MKCQQLGRVVQCRHFHSVWWLNLERSSVQVGLHVWVDNLWFCVVKMSNIFFSTISKCERAAWEKSENQFSFEKSLQSCYLLFFQLDILSSSDVTGASSIYTNLWRSSDRCFYLTLSLVVTPKPRPRRPADPSWVTVVRTQAHTVEVC